ncbi:MAG: hypothetical protein ABI427_20225 [Solirubrobacteraceae bacterium]
MRFDALTRAGAIGSAPADRAVSEFDLARLICHPHAAPRGRGWVLRDNLTADDALDGTSQSVRAALAGGPAPLVNKLVPVKGNARIGTQSRRQAWSGRS